MRRVLLLALVAAAVVVAAGLRAGPAPGPAVPAAEAQRLALADPALAPVRARVTSARVVRVDAALAKVTLFAGPRAVAEAGVRRDGRVVEPLVLPRDRFDIGAPVLHRAWLLVLLAALFAVAAGMPAAGLAAAAVPVLLLDRGLVAPAMAAAAALLAAVAGAAWRGSSPRAALPPLPPRMLRLVTAGTAVAAVGLTVWSTGVVDVAWASMEGATLLRHGVLPYGHMTGDVVHGDTYGPLAYALYLPVAALWPVRDGWDDPQGALLVGALALVATAWWTARATRSRAAGLAVLAFPPALLAASSGGNDVLVAALLALALALHRHPARSAAAITAAGLVKIAPFALLPLWLCRHRGADLRRALLASAALVAACAAALVALDGPGALADAARAVGFQAQRRSLWSPWTALDLDALRLPAQAAAAALAVLAAGAVATRPASAEDPRRVAALALAVLAALQLAANYWSPTYLVWLAPLALAAWPPPRPAAAAP